MTQDNLRFYNPGAKVPKEACKEFNNGRFKGTDINRMWRVRKLTEMFGPVGIGWTFNLVETWERKLDNSNAVVIYAKGELKIKVDGEWSEPIVGYGGNYIVQAFQSGDRINDEAYKMVGTDALGHACTFLGIGESVYWNEATKYTQSTNEEEPKPKTVPPVKKTDSFFGRTTAKAAPTQKDASLVSKDSSAALDEPTDKEIFNALLGVKDPKVKDMLSAYMRDNGIMSIYETLPEQRLTMYQMVRSVA